MTANEFAEQNGFKRARKIKPWNGYKCFEAVYADTEETSPVPLIGFPQIILSRNGALRMADYDEAMAYVAEVENG